MNLVRTRSKTANEKNQAKNFHVLNRLNKMAQDAHKRAEYETAECLAQQVIQLKSSIWGRNYPGCGTDLHNLGMLNISTRDYKRAKQLLIRSLQIHKKDKSTNQIDVTATLETLATIRKEIREEFPVIS